MKFKPVGVLIDVLVKNTGTPLERKLPYHLWFNRIIACIRILRGRGMAVYYKEDE